MVNAQIKSRATGWGRAWGHAPPDARRGPAPPDAGSLPWRIRRHAAVGSTDRLVVSARSREPGGGRLGGGRYGHPDLRARRHVWVVGSRALTVVPVPVRLDVGVAEPRSVVVARSPQKERRHANEGVATEAGVAAEAGVAVEARMVMEAAAAMKASVASAAPMPRGMSDRGPPEHQR